MYISYCLHRLVFVSASAVYFAKLRFFFETQVIPGKVVTPLFSVFFAFELAAVEEEEGGGADDGEGGADDGGGGEAEAVMDGEASYRGGEGVGDVEGYLYAGASEHLATFGIPDDEVLQGTSDAEEAGGRDEGEQYARHLVGGAEIERGHYDDERGGDEPGDEGGGMAV